MRRRSLRRRLLPPALIAASVLVGVGCGVVNPDLLGAAGVSNTAANNLTNGVVVMMLINETDVSADVAIVGQRITGNATLTTTTDLSWSLTAPSHDHIVLVEDCELDWMQVTQASYAGTNGAVTIPATVAPAIMGETLQCGGGLVITISGTPPGVFLNAYSF